jgi:hypothetical protein
MICTFFFGASLGGLRGVLGGARGLQIASSTADGVLPRAGMSARRPSRTPPEELRVIALCGCSTSE